jgi:hypothetical protein
MNWLVMPPNSWWTVDDLALGMTGGITLYYRPGVRQPLRDDKGRWLRDSAGRTALEAFGSLPLGTMYDRLRAGDESWAALSLDSRSAALAADPARESRRWLKAMSELVEFVRTFGPLGFEWSRRFPVANPEADRALDRLEAGRYRSGRAPRRWQVIFPAPGFATAKVGLAHHERGTWDDRVRHGDPSLPHDLLGAEPTGPLWGHQNDLKGALNLVRALAESDPNPHAIRAAAGALPKIGDFDVSDHGVRDPVDVQWREAMRGPRAEGRPWSPFDEHPTGVNWPAMGRLALSEYLSAQLAWMSIAAGVDGLERIRTRWTAHSLLEVIYLQLLEHVQDRLPFGVGECERCGGPILRTRLSEGTRNRAHRGCAPVVRKRRQRERDRIAATEEAPA